MMHDPGTVMFQTGLVLVLLIMFYLNGAILILFLVERWKKRRKRIQDARKAKVDGGFFHVTP